MDGKNGILEGKLAESIHMVIDSGKWVTLVSGIVDTMRAHLESQGKRAPHSHFSPGSSPLHQLALHFHLYPELCVYCSSLE